MSARVPRSANAVPDAMSRSVLRAAVWTSGIAAVSGAMLGAVVALLCWLPDAGESGHPTSAVRAGVLGFLAAHHAGLVLSGVPTTLAPLLGLVVIAALAWRAGTILADVAAHLGVQRWPALLRASLVQAGCYAGVCAALVPLARLGSTSARPIPVAVAAFVIFGCVAVPVVVRPVLPVLLSAQVRAGVRGAAAGLAVYVGAGALLVAGSLVVHAGDVMRLSRQVGGGVSGVPVLVLGVLAAPNAAVAGAAYLAGPGFAIGAGTSFTAFSTGHGVLPAFPLLGALPHGHGATAAVLAWMIVSLLGAGLLAAHVAGREHGVRGAAVAVSVAGCGMALLAWLGGGAIGGGRLSVVGASPWQVGLAVAGEIAAVALAYFGVQWLRSGRDRAADARQADAREADEPGEAQAPDGPEAPGDPELAGVSTPDFAPG